VFCGSDIDHTKRNVHELLAVVLCINVHQQQTSLISEQKLDELNPLYDFFYVTLQRFEQVCKPSIDLHCVPTFLHSVAYSFVT